MRPMLLCIFAALTFVNWKLFTPCHTIKFAQKEGWGCLHWEGVATPETPPLDPGLYQQYYCSILHVYLCVYIIMHNIYTQVPRLPPPVLPAWWLVRLPTPSQLQLQCSGLPVLELITTLSVSHQTSPHWEDRSPPLALHWSYKMCLTTLHTLSVLWSLTVLVAVLLLRL